MLIQKKIGREKLIIYIVIIAIMIGGIVFFVYKNYSLGKGGGAMVIEAPAEMANVNSSNYSLDNLSKNAPLTPKEISQPANGDVISPAVQAKPSSDLIDLSLLSELKFKMLKGNILKPQESLLGKNNPFASY